MGTTRDEYLAVLQEFQHLLIESMGTFRCSEEHPYDAARQGAVSHGNSGTVELHPGNNFDQALSGLEGFSHIWLIFQFHKNTRWKPMVQPPRGDRKVGVFASRTPYRPNAIGMSCVRLGDIKGLHIEVFDHDLLNGTPILDIKPYLPYADSVPDAATGWLDENISPTYSINMSTTAREQLAWLESQHIDCIEAFLFQQLIHEPTNSKKKRVQHLQGQTWEIAYRTWRVRFTIEDTSRHITVQSVHSGYTAADLEDSPDPHNDKPIHRAYLNRPETG